MSAPAREIEITAPYNFVPLSGWIYTPPWADRVSHDLPFRDGVSGTLTLALTAHTPLLVGGEQRPATKEAAGEVRPFRLPDGRYAIPGSSLKGMIRNVLEIAAFGKLRLLDDRWLSVRDLTAGARRVYGSRLTEEVKRNTYRPLAKAGWLTLGAGAEGPEWRLRPCAYARVQQEELIAWGRGIGVAAPEKIKERRVAQAAKEKYALWGDTVETTFDLEPERDHDHTKPGRPPLLLRYALAKGLGRGKREGRVVFTGQPCDNDGRRPGCKHMEFVFFDEAAEERAVTEEVMRGFLQVHEASDDWQWWRGRLRSGARVPVFYLEERGEVASLGLAMMYRLPYLHSIGATVDHTHPDHRGDWRYDLPELLFGTVNDEERPVAPGGLGPKRSLKGRVQLGLAVAEGAPKVIEELPATILNGPKPSFLPNYLRQGGRTGNEYRNYSDDDAEIRGWKRYPVRPAAKLQPLTPDQEKNHATQIRLHPLAAGTRFTARVHFHNLQPEELGALLWALEWGGRPELRHALGMGKPFGFGQLSIAVAGSPTLRANSGEPLTLAGYRERFVAGMEQAYGAAQHAAGVARPQPWAESEQLRQLIAMADPAHAPGQPGKLAHLRLSAHPRVNEFVDAKKAGAVLADYVAPQGRDDGELFPRGRGGASRPATGRAPAAAGPALHPWLAAQLKELAARNNAGEEETLRGKALAAAWAALEEGEEKTAIRENIVALWQARGWWEQPPGKATRQAKGVYEGQGS